MYITQTQVQTDFCDTLLLNNSRLGISLLDTYFIYNSDDDI